MITRTRMRQHRLFDYLGIGTSVLCALQCGLTAAALIVQPVLWLSPLWLGLPVASWIAGERVLLALSAGFAGLALLRGWRRHRDPRPLVGGALGLAMVAAGVALHSSLRLPLGPALVVAGGLALIVAHSANLTASARADLDRSASGGAAPEGDR